MATQGPQYDFDATMAIPESSTVETAFTSYFRRTDLHK